MKEKKQLPQVSDSEWLVLEALWESHPLSASEIVQSLSVHRWSPKTIKTLIFRLSKKGVIGYEERGREYSYFPLIDKSAYVNQSSQSFLKKVFKGSVTPLVAHFIENEELGPEDIQALKEMIHRLESP